LTLEDIPQGKLLWRCRRGMKELDVLLTHFVETRYPALDAEAKACFIHLLEFQDPDLYSWLTGKTTPEKPAIAAMIDEINRSGVGVH